MIAVVDKKTKTVMNIIVADIDKDVPPDGCMFIKIVDECQIGWKWNSRWSKFVAPKK